MVGVDGTDMPGMWTLRAILIYVATSGLLLGGGATAVSVLSPIMEVTEPEVVQGTLSSSPRIAAWQERMAEEKVYAERHAIREAEEKARWAALGRSPRTPDVSASEQSSPNDLVFQENDARARRAQREMMQRAQQQYGRETEPFSDAPASIRPRYDNAVSTSRDESRGN